MTNADQVEKPALTALERRRKISQKEAAYILNMSITTLRRRILAVGTPKVFRLSPKRISHELGEIVDLADIAD